MSTKQGLSVLEKDFLVSFIIAIIVGLVFYYNNLGCTQNIIDVYWVEFGMIMPFLLPLFFLFKIIVARPRRIRYG